MPRLLIYASNTGWQARIAETDIEYDFRGATPELQADNVMRLRSAMGVDRAALDEAAKTVFRGIANDDAGEAAISELFSATQFVYEGEVLYSVEEAGVTLLDELAEVAAAWVV